MANFLFYFIFLEGENWCLLCIRFLTKLQGAWKNADCTNAYKEKKKRKKKKLWTDLRSEFTFQIKLFMVLQMWFLLANFFFVTCSLYLLDWIPDSLDLSTKGIETFLIHNRPQSFLKINIFSGVFLYSEKGTFLLCFFSKTFRHFFPFDFFFSSVFF